MLGYLTDRPEIGRDCARAQPATRAAGRAAVLLLAGVLAGCAAASLDHAGSLSSYAGLTRSDGLLTQSSLSVDEAGVLAARTVRILPTSVTEKARGAPVSAEQRRLIANAIDRSLCVGLSERFTVVVSKHADLIVQAFVSDIVPTNEYAAAASKAAAIAKSVVLPDIPGPSLRLPIGLGSLSVEAEARGAAGEQRAAMIWGRGANALFGTTRVSAAGDAYEFASAFGDDFSALLVTGESPFGKIPGLPSAQRVQAMSGGASSQAACEAFGRAPGVSGFLGGIVGAPPEWTDKGAADPAVIAVAPSSEKPRAYNSSPSSQ